MTLRRLVTRASLSPYLGDAFGMEDVVVVQELDEFAAGELESLGEVRPKPKVHRVLEVLQSASAMRFADPLDPSPERVVANQHLKVLERLCQRTLERRFEEPRVVSRDHDRDARGFHGVTLAGMGGPVYHRPMPPP